MKTKKPHMTWLKCLTQVRKCIQDGNWFYICWAISYVLESADCEHLIAPYRRKIEKQLQGHSTYRDWLKQRHPDFWKSNWCTPGGIQPGRLAWLDNMIKLEKERLSKCPT